MLYCAYCHKEYPETKELLHTWCKACDSQGRLFVNVLSKRKCEACEDPIPDDHPITVCKECHTYFKEQGVADSVFEIKGAIKSHAPEKVVTVQEEVIESKEFNLFDLLKGE